VGLEKGADFEARLDSVVGLALDHDSPDFTELPSDSPDSQSKFDFYCEPSEFAKLTSALENHASATVLGSEVEYEPVQKTEISDQDAETLEELVNALEEFDDVMRVWTSV